jgi:hypothetical protein
MRCELISHFHFERKHFFRVWLLNGFTLDETSLLEFAFLVLFNESRTFVGCAIHAGLVR